MNKNTNTSLMWNFYFVWMWQPIEAFYYVYIFFRVLLVVDHIKSSQLKFKWIQYRYTDMCIKMTCLCNKKHRWLTVEVSNQMYKLLQSTLWRRKVSRCKLFLNFTFLKRLPIPQFHSFVIMTYDKLILQSTSLCLSFTLN